VAAKMGYINAVVQPAETRAKIIAALEALKDKKETRPWKKHGNIPM
jgi:acetyl-CoA carboxylase carboxyltransferase component